MSAEFSIRQVSAPAFRDAAMPPAARQSAATNLPAAQCVTPAADTAAASNDERDRAEERTLKMRSYRRALDSLVAEQAARRRINREV
jgi:hypothetical protein